MVTSTEGVSKETPIDELQHIEKPKSEFHEPESSQKGRHSVLPETASGEVPQTQISDTNAHTSQSNSEGGSQTYQQGSSFSLIPKKELETLQHKQNLDGEMHSTQSYHEGISLSASTKKEMDDMQQGQNIDTGNCLLESRAPLIIPEKADSLEQKQGLDSGGSPQYDKENVTLTRRPEKALDKLQPRRNPDTGVHALQADAEASTPSRIVEKPLEDGYNWRKYGQKLVRGNEFIRSYYKCTSPNCPAKKQVERPHNGHLTDIHYLGRHEHPKPQHSPLPVSDMPISTRSPDGSSLSTAATESTSRHGETSQQIESTENLPHSTVSASNEVGMASQPKERRYEVDNNNCDSNPKRQKRDVPGSDDTLVNKLNSDSRLVIKTTSEVDIVSDGYRWRKYGQKLVKGNPNPRSYYRCSNGGCPVKKHVERASHDPRVVITTYEGQHDHDMPPARTVTHNVAGSNATKPDEKEAVGLEMMVRISAN